MTTTEIILAQLGGNRFLAMTGAVCLASEIDRELTIKLPKLSKISALTVTLDALTDTYRLQAYRGRGLRMQPSGGPVYHLHAGQLAGAFVELTGMRVTL